MVFIGISTSRPILKMMGTPDEVLDLAITYIDIFYLGMPGFMLYNFGAAIFRSIGDTKRPLYFLTLSGIINVILNLILVIVFHMGVAGVAIATVFSQYVSAILILVALTRGDRLRLDFKKLKFNGEKIKEIIRIGLPAGIEGILFSISNVLIQASINSFGPSVMAGNTAASNIEGFVFMAMNALYQTSLSFTAMNMGAKKYHRVDSITLKSNIIVFIIGLVLGLGAYFAGEFLLSIYTSEAEVVKFGLERLMIICTTYAICGVMDVMVGSIRGIGYSIIPTIITFLEFV